MISIAHITELPNRKPGFTRLDLVVVTLVAFVALAILLPFCQQSHGTSRRLQCMDYEKELCMALFKYETKYREFPGYRQKLPIDDAGWGVMILPQLDRDDLWQDWKQGKTHKALLQMTFCPSDPPPNQGPEDGWSSYAANTLICQDGRGLSLDYIASKDGTGNTLLVAENLRSMKPHTWWDTEPKVVGFTDGPMAYNVQSNHLGGAVVTFCDGHVIFLRDDVDDGVYKALVTPDGGEKVDEDRL